MATTTSKPAAKKKSAAASKKPAAVKKTAAKKPAVAKKPAAKKPAVTKKPAVKKAAAKKPVPKKKPVKKLTAVKKPAAKKATTAKKTIAKKPAVKKAAAAKKPVAKKPVAKKAAAAKKPVTKKPAAAKKTVAKKPALTKPVVIQKPVIKPVIKEPLPEETTVPKLRYLDLFDAYAQGKLPRNNGYIVCAFFSENSAYSVYEIVSYSDAKEIFQTAEGLTFVANGKKLFILAEPAAYSFKFQEPASRKQGEKIDKLFSELEKITAKNQTSIYIAKEPNELIGSFTILKPAGKNFTRVVFNLDDVISTIKELFELSFSLEAGIPQVDAKNAAALIANTVNKQMSLKG